VALADIKGLFRIRVTLHQDKDVGWPIAFEEETKKGRTGQFERLTVAGSAADAISFELH
jgi:hypothetical protein